MNTLDLLQRSRARITDPARHTRGVFARDATGMPVASTADSACCWCALGALQAECDSIKEYLSASHALRSHISVLISTFSDARPHSQVLWMYDQAIAAEQKKELACLSI